MRFTRANGPVMLVSSSNLLPQNGEQGAEAAAIILNPRGKLVTKRKLHAKASNNHVGDPVLPTVVR